MKCDASYLLTSGTNSVVIYFKQQYIDNFGIFFPNSKCPLHDQTYTKTPKFPERNLTVNFAEAIKKRYPKAVCWYELQFREDGQEENTHNKHFDLVVIIPDDEHPAVLVCESKRNFPEKRYEIITKDKLKIINYAKCIHEVIKTGKDFAYYGVILLDGWQDSKRLNNAGGNAYLKKWTTNTLWRELFKEKQICDGDLSEININFKDCESTINKTIVEQYCLKIIMWKCNAENFV